MAALVLLSVLMIVLENTTRLLEPLRQRLVLVLAPVYFTAELPYLAGGGLSDVVATREALLTRTGEQERRLLELARVAQQYDALKAENERLRALLGSRAQVPARVLIGELIGVVPAPDTQQIILDKGSSDGIEVGAPVVDAYGLFGRIIEVGRYASRVLLVTDANHAVPVQLNRNGVRSIAGGTGDPAYLELENVPITADVVEGDLIETSGLGGGFPVGYPVGRVTSVRVESTSAFALVQVRPMAQLDRSRQLLVILDVASATDRVETDSGARSSDGEPVAGQTPAADPVPEAVAPAEAAAAGPAPVSGDAQADVAPAVAPTAAPSTTETNP